MNTRNETEIAHFTKDSGQWWDENGPFRPLHRLNPVRMKYIKTMITDHFDRNDENIRALDGLKILDIGCGGGLISEPLARLGAQVTGIDADQNAIATAASHAKEMNLKIEYISGAAEDLIDQNKKYDVVLALEVIEHVENPKNFVSMLSTLCTDKGLIIFSTLNRTPKSFALGIVAAEYILRWVPRGTHSWQKFIKPSELGRMARQVGLSVKSVMGLTYHPLEQKFMLNPHDVDVNYFMVCRK
jgi:2-polyprenyl-6-hydroxyphenyl methylase/3-demethylubiquinone-9 3-methyltransferase